MTERGRDWLLEAGKYAMAMAAVAAVVAAAISLAVRPMIADERIAREKAQDRITSRMVLMQRDAFDIIDIVMTKSEDDRTRKVALLREKWAADDARLR
jgi:hypothetical protein